MNNRQMIKELHNAYDVTSKNKIRFIRTIKKPNTSLFSFIISQFKLISSKVYISCLIYFGILLFLLLSSNNAKQYIALAAGVPFFSLLLIAIIDASRACRMEELEMASLYSLKMVVLARMLIMSVFTITLILIMAICTSRINNESLSQIISFFFIPYFTNIYLNLLILKKFRKDGIKYCLVASSIICLLTLYLVDNPLPIFINSYCYIGILSMLIALSIIESRNYINGLEEYVWNLQ
ncbi:MAG: hypothetical protein KBT35_06640 [Firmicutes bacterium]|nr:hypothetical protein [Candidatus Colivicinus equi]